MPHNESSRYSATVLIAVSAVIAIVAIVAINRVCKKPRERFTSDHAPGVYKAARELFENNSNATYSDYKAAIPEADPVQFADVRKLWISGHLSLDAVRRAL
jgi:hypothetical protein